MKDYAQRSHSKKRSLLLPFTLILLLIIISSGGILYYKKTQRQPTPIKTTQTTKPAAHPVAAKAQPLDFYTLLPNINVPSDASSQNDRLNYRYQLEVTSIVSKEQLQNIQSELAKLGLPTFYPPTSAHSPSASLLHIGPFDQLKDTQAAQRVLQQSGIHSILLTTSH